MHRHVVGGAKCRGDDRAGTNLWCIDDHAGARLEPLRDDPTVARLLTKDPDARPSAGQIRARLSRVARGQRYRMRTARLPAVGPPPPAARQAADPTPEIFPPVPAAPATSPGHSGLAVAAGDAEP